MKFSLDLRRLINQDNNIVQLIVMTILIFAIMTVLSPDKFLRYYNFESIAYIFPELGLLSIAMMIAMLTGGIDLSVIGIANLSGILAGILFKKFSDETGVADTGLSVVMLGAIIALGTGLVAGALNGLLITKARITPILATLGTGQVFTGLAIVFTGGPAIVGFPDAWAFVGNGRIFGLPTPLVLFVVIAALIAFILTRTTFGMNLMLIGTNPKAALFAGLKRERMVIYSYMMTGVLASVAGIILSGRTNAAKSDYGTSYLLQAVLIAVLGGTNPAGGRGTVLGISIAVIALMLLSSGFQILRFSNHLIDLIWGAFLLLVIALNAYQGRSSR
ncbi:MAG: ABC transporter permease [Thalassospira sp.]|uniref:ABC transporter permease n=1 Tax=Thalassospira sp. GB04J01 TaxID=1485225 RepID=UPI000C0ED061|nr:ABC transporter permease [Thalassospira sp. GB04J01]MBV16266.1 ABC transporter permease [Thalassospira sp.]|tara:strand:+ start:18695 stop:19690 length:996 start_codon:yes stop_codon:yes gene_type:complete